MACLHIAAVVGCERMLLGRLGQHVVHVLLQRHNAAAAATFPLVLIIIIAWEPNLAHISSLRSSPAAKDSIDVTCAVLCIPSRAAGKWRRAARMSKRGDAPPSCRCHTHAVQRLPSATTRTQSGARPPRRCQVGVANVWQAQAQAQETVTVNR